MFVCHCVRVSFCYVYVCVCNCAGARVCVFSVHVNMRVNVSVNVHYLIHMSMYMRMDERVYLSMLLVCISQIKLAFVFLPAYVRFTDAVNPCLFLCKCFLFCFSICVCVVARVCYCELDFFYILYTISCV